MIYVAASMMVAVAIWLQNIMLKRCAGKLPDSPFFYILSMLDSVWVVVSCVAVYFLEFNSIVMSIPVAYMLYTFSSWVYAARTMNDGEIPTSPDDIVFADSYLSFCQSFAIVFFLLCGALVALPYWGGSVLLQVG